MRRITNLTIVATALLIAAPAAAQNTAGATNTTDANTTVAAPTANDVAATGAAATPVDQTAPVTTDTNTVAVDETTSAPAPEQKSFPWGVVGLIGLLGLIPRARRGR